ncbi:MAG TPA: MlaD family protein [Myxococcales bacterium]|nr:MlaD family protein [Myxococcales bacterium]
MEPEAKYTAVGTAVLVLIALLAATLVWLGRTGASRHARLYQIDFARQSLGGLRARSDVLMRGIQVGEVTSVQFSARRPGVIEVVVALDPATPVRLGTRARVERNLITGSASVELRAAGEDSPLLVEARPGEELPVIGEDAPIQDMSGTVNQLAQQAGDAVQRVSDALSPANRAALSEILENLRRASKHADATLGKADVAIERLGKAAASAGADADRLAARYDAVGADVQRLSKHVDSFIAGSDEELRATSQALRAAAESVDAAAARLREPRQVLFGPAEGSLGPGEDAK